MKKDTHGNSNQEKDRMARLTEQTSGQEQRAVRKRDIPYDEKIMFQKDIIILHVCETNKSLQNTRSKS